MDLSAVAWQRVSRAEASASASASRRTEDDDDDDDLDADEAKALVRAFVKHALDGVRSGERAQYYELLEALEGLEHARVSQDKLLMLTVLVECVSSLDENAHEELLRRVLSVSLWRCADDVAGLIVEFCVNLVSTHTGSLLQTFLEMLVSSFVPPPGYDVRLLERDERRREEDANHETKRRDEEIDGRNDVEAAAAEGPSRPTPRIPTTITEEVVRAIETVLTLVPLAASVLRPILLRSVPHKSSHKTIQTHYLRAAFRLAETESGASLRDALLRGVVVHLLEVDVEITWAHIRDPRERSPNSSDEDVEDDMDAAAADDDDDDDAEGTGEETGAGIFELDDIEKTIEIEMTRQAAVWERDARARAGHFRYGARGGYHGTRGGRGSSPTTSSGVPGDGRDGAAVDETADALDSMMETVLAHIDARIDRGDRAAVSDTIVSVFLKTLLPAHTSKFTQFLVFHACARDSAEAAAAARRDGSAGFGDASVPTPAATPAPVAAVAAVATFATFAASSSSSFGEARGLSGRIADALIERVTDPHHPPSGRLASAAYLASFLARAAFLPPAFIVAALSRVHRWCAATIAAASNGAGVTSVGASMPFSESGGQLARGFGSSFKIAESASESGGAPEPEKPETGARVEDSGFANASAATLAVFDSACQALMYVLVYRMEDILNAGGEPSEALRALPLRDALYNRLEPTKTCLPSVVLEFLHRAADAGLPGFDDALVERHKSERREAKHDQEISPSVPLPQLRRSGSSAAALGGDGQLAEAVRQRRPLRMFFPFDPYLLRRSAALLRLPITYVAWRGEVRRDAPDAEDEDEDDLEVDEGTMDDDDESEAKTSDDDEESNERGESRSGSHGGSHGYHSFNSSLPNSFNPRPRKLTRGLLGPQPLFGGGRSVSPGSAEVGKPAGFRFGAGGAMVAGAAAPPIVGFGVAAGVPANSQFGTYGSPGTTREPPSPSRLGVSVGSDAGGAKEMSAAAAATWRFRGTPPRVPKRTTR